MEPLSPEIEIWIAMHVDGFQVELANIGIDSPHAAYANSGEALRDMVRQAYAKAAAAAVLPDFQADVDATLRANERARMAE